MREKFYQYTLKSKLAKKYSHTTYLASLDNSQEGYGDPECQVVLTVFAPSLFRLPHEREKFLKKAKCIEMLRHPHMAPILDVGIEQDQPFIARKYISHDSLRSSLKQLSPHHLELGKALRIVSQVGQALAYAHEQNIIHGNIKPENVLLDTHGQALLTDFSLVGRNDVVIRDQAAEEYAFCYMAPEQLSGISDAKSDQYALGCLAYELITGRLPFATASLASIMGQHRTTNPIPLSNGGVDLPPSLEVAVLKTLSHDPKERFDDFLLFLEVLQSTQSSSLVFPLTRSTNSHNTKMVSPVRPSAIAQIAASPIRQRAARHSMPRIFEPSGALSSTEVDVAESVVITSPVPTLNLVELEGSPPISEPLAAVVLPSSQLAIPFSGEKDFVDDGENDSPSQPLTMEHKLSTSSTTMPELIPLAETSLSGLATATLIAEQETGGPLLADILIQQEGDEISESTPLGSFDYGQSESKVNQTTLSETILSLLERSNETVLASTLTQHSKRKPIGRQFLFLSLLVGLAVSASVVMGWWAISIFRSSGTVKSDTPPIAQVVGTQTASNHTSVSSSIPHTNIPNIQSAPISFVQPTHTPTAQPTSSASPTNGLPTNGRSRGGRGEGFWGGW